MIHLIFLFILYIYYYFLLSVIFNLKYFIIIQPSLLKAIFISIHFMYQFIPQIHFIILTKFIYSFINFDY